MSQHYGQTAVTTSSPVPLLTRNKNMAAEKRKFVIPSVEELDEKEATSSNSGQTFKLFKSSSDSFKSVKKNSDAEARKRLLKALSQTTAKSAENKTSPSSKIETESRGDVAAVKDAHLTCSFSSTDNNEAGDVGKTFKDNFAFLKNTKHYEEAEAKMKEIESAKPVQCKVSIPSKPKSNAIQVNPRQKANPVLKFIRCVPWEFSDIVPDYVMGVTTCALFLSLRYHHFNPNYIHERLKQLGKSYELRILLVLVDVKDPHQTLRELAKMAILADLTLMLSWSSEEAGKYLEIYKVYENKPVDVLQGQNDGDYLSKLQDCLTTVKGINKTDVLTLSSTFGTLAGITSASQDDLTFLPGFGEVKASRLQNILHEPFLVKNKSQADNKT